MVSEHTAESDAVVERTTQWAVRRPDGHVVKRTFSMVDSGHAWSEDEARHFVSSPAFTDWTVVRRERTVTFTSWRAGTHVTPPGEGRA